MRDRELEADFKQWSAGCDIANHRLPDGRAGLWPCPNPPHKRVAVYDGNGELHIRILCRYHWRREQRLYKLGGVHPLAVLPYHLKRWMPV